MALLIEERVQRPRIFLLDKGRARISLFYGFATLSDAPSAAPAPIAANFFAALHAVSDDIQVGASDSPAGA